MQRREMELRPDIVRLAATYVIVAQSPGVIPADVAHRLDVAHTVIDRLLPAFNPPLPLMWEDDQNRLHVLANNPLQPTPESGQTELSKSTE